MPTAAPVQFDSLIASRGRLRILTALAAEPRVEFVRLRQQTRLTDGNLATHARRLEAAGFVAIEKAFVERKPITHVRLTPLGREALERHARELIEALGMQAPLPSASRQAPPSNIVVTASVTADDDEWVD